MEKNQKRISEFELPEEIIHHIQSFMDSREAARTTLLSKQWHRAWFTRPNLSFDQDDFSKNEFEEFTKKTMQRYEDQNLNIQSLSLGIKRCKDYPLAAKLISKAIKLGASHLHIKIDFDKPFVLPDLVFQSETLTRLYVRGCKLGFQRRKKGVTACSKLKSLELSRVYDVDENIIRDLILRCPFIEELTLERVRPLDMRDTICKSNLWPNFACLKELVLIMDYFSYYDSKDIIRICSTSLERITIRSYMSRNVNTELDVPNIRMFGFEGYYLPRIELKTTASEWQAHIGITFGLYDNTSASWFKSLNQLVKMFGQSRLSLCLNLWDGKSDGDGYVGDGLDIPTLENLTVTGSDTMSPGFLEALLWSCSPKCINIERHCVFDIEEVNVEGFPKLQSLPWQTLLDASRG